MKTVQNIQSFLKGLAKSGVIEDAMELGQNIWEHFTKDFHQSSLMKVLP